MTTIHGHSAAAVVPQFARAGSFLEGLAAQDFARLGSALAPDARLRALLPRGLREWTGADTGEDGRIARLDLLCTGYRPEGDDA
jgi:hypothetical protein